MLASTEELVKFLLIKPTYTGATRSKPRKEKGSRGRSGRKGAAKCETVRARTSAQAHTCQEGGPEEICREHLRRCPSSQQHSSCRKQRRPSSGTCHVRGEVRAATTMTTQEKGIQLPSKPPLTHDTIAKLMRRRATWAHCSRTETVQDPTTCLDVVTAGFANETS